MSTHGAPEVLPACLVDRRALRAWDQVSSEPLHPARIEVLKRKRKSSVYRMIGAAEGHPTLIAKRCRAETALLERLVYEELLARLPLSSLRCYGFAPEQDSEFCWLFLEDAGAQAYSTASGEDRRLAGRWLGMLHRSSVMAELRALLPERGPRFYLQLLRLSRASLLTRVHHPELSEGETRLLRTLVAHLEAAEAHWPQLEAFLDGHPRTLVHGDFVIKNIRIRTDTAGPTLMVMDWEMAGWGVPAADLAQFVGKSASPDLDVYLSVLARDFPELVAGDIRRLAEFGALLRIVHKVYWETQTMVGDSYPCLATPLQCLARFESQLTAALRALHWEAA